MSDSTVSNEVATVSNEVAAVSDKDTAAIVASFKTPGETVFSSITGDDFASKVAVISAMSNAEKLADHLGETINLRDFVIQQISLVDENTGEVVRTIRTVLIDDNGSAYAAVSDGIVSVLQNITGVLGMPTVWPAPLPVQAVEERTRKGFRVTTLKVVTTSKK